MGIGTSIGAYYEDDFAHAAGIDKGVLKPNENIDNNVKTPNEARTDKQLDDAELDPATGMGIEVAYKGKPDIIDKLTGLNTERYQMWPERMVREAFRTFSKGMKGEIPGYVLDPDTGDFHTSPEMMGAAESMMPFAMSGIMPLKMHIRGPAAEAIAKVPEEGPDPFRQFMATRGRRQSSNIEDSPQAVIDSQTLAPERVVPEGMELNPFYDSRFPEQNARMNIPEFRPRNGGVSETNQLEQVPWPFTEEQWTSLPPELRTRALERTSASERTLHEFIPPERMTDDQFYNWGEYQRFSDLTPEQNSRWTSIDNRYFEGNTRENFLQDYENSIQRSNQDFFRSNKERVKTEFDKRDVEGIDFYANKDNEKMATYREFMFGGPDGKIHDLEVSLRNNGKDIYVQWAGDHSFEAVNKIGTKGVRALFKALAKEFPEAETVSGFRVSGARKYSGKGSDDARMRIPGRAQTREGKDPWDE